MYSYSSDQDSAGGTLGAEDFTIAGGTTCTIPASGIVLISGGGAYIFVECGLTSAEPSLTAVDTTKGLAKFMRVTTDAASVTSVDDLRVRSPLALSGPINPEWYGANGLDTANDDVAIQAAINAACAITRLETGTTLYIPPGDWRIGAKLTVPGSCYLSVRGASVRAATLSWYGGNNDAILEYTGPNTLIIVEQVQFRRGNAATGVVGLRLGTVVLGSSVIGPLNATVRHNLFRDLDIGLEVWNEADGVRVDQNWFFDFTTAGTWFRTRAGCVAGCGSAKVVWLGNHAQGGSPGAYPFRTDNSLNVSLIGNTVELGPVLGYKGFRLDNVSGFIITGNHGESSAASDASNGPMIDLRISTGGFIAGNSSAGIPGAPALIAIDTTSSNITIGSFTHTCSGGCPSSLISLGAGVFGISIVGEPLVVSGSVALTSGTGRIDWGISAAGSSAYWFFRRNGVITSGLTVGDGNQTTSRLVNHICATTAWNPGTLGVGLTVETDVTVTGATTLGIAYAGLSSMEAVLSGWVISAYVRLANTIHVVLKREGGATATIGNGTLRACAWEY